MNQIKIPAGMRDTVPQEYVRKKYLRDRIIRVFERSGYEQIETPLLEYYKTYADAFSSLTEQEMYKFFDSDGQILSLRTDMTVPIARVTASKFASSEPPFRFCYCSDVYKVRQAFAGKRNEVTDCGIELIGMDEKADAEILVTALDVMAAIGAQDYQLEIGNSGLFRKACRLSGLSEEETRQLADLSDRKSMVELEEFLNTLSLDEKQKNFFMNLPLMAGESGILKEAEAMCFDESLKEEIAKLEKLLEILSSAGHDGHVTFDLSKVPHLGYYTGIIFEGFVGGVGTAVLSGGRYDNLLAVFGRDLPACGFSVKLDYLLEAVEVPETKVTKVIWSEKCYAEAIRKAAELRKTGTAVLEYREGADMEVIG